MGWLEGIEPSTAVPQTAVLPLNYSHHIILFLRNQPKTENEYYDTKPIKERQWFVEEEIRGNKYNNKRTNKKNGDPDIKWKSLECE